MTQTPESDGLTLDAVANDLDTTKEILFTLARQYERIDRTLDRVVLAQQENQKQIQANESQIQANSTAIAQLVEFARVASQRQAEIEQSQVEYRQKQAETDQRFNVLLEEVRYLIRNFGNSSNGNN